MNNNHSYEQDQQMEDLFFDMSEANSLRHIRRLAENAAIANENVSKAITDGEEPSEFCLQLFLQSNVTALQAISMFVQAIELSKEAA
jgi:hypothetical protein